VVAPATRIVTFSSPSGRKAVKGGPGAFVGDDWSEAHHDVEIHDEARRRVVRHKPLEGISGIALVHELIGQHAADCDDADDPPRW
jgi:hypothetical protein